jgi:hypothetical protein
MTEANVPANLWPPTVPRPGPVPPWLAPAAPAPAPAPAVKVRRSRWDLILAVSCLLVLAAAATLVVRGRTLSTEAGKARAEATRLDHRAAALATVAHTQQRRSQSISSATTALGDSLDVLGTDMGKESDAQQHFVDVANQSASLFNQGSISASVGLLQSQGAPALATVTAEQATVDADLVTTQADLVKLEGALHG